MRTQERHQTFETNSSSVHSLCITHKSETRDTSSISHISFEYLDKAAFFAFMNEFNSHEGLDKPEMLEYRASILWEYMIEFSRSVQEYMDIIDIGKLRSMMRFIESTLDEYGITCSWPSITAATRFEWFIEDCNSEFYDAFKCMFDNSNENLLIDYIFGNFAYVVYEDHYEHEIDAGEKIEEQYKQIFRDRR